MASILDRLNKEIYSEISTGVAIPKVQEQKETGAKMYLVYLENDQVFDVVFTSVDPDATFSAVDGNVKVVLTHEEFMKVAKSSSTYATANLLGVTMQAKVLRVDMEENKVYVQLAGATKLSYEANMRTEINDELARNLAMGKKPIVWGVIKRVTKNKILVDILGRGILGFLNKSNWSKDYVRNMEAVCKPGEFFQFEVYGRAQKMEGKPPAWILGRKNLTISAWDTLDVEGLKEDGVILVRCIEKPVGKTYWWGVSDRVPGIDILGDFTSKFPDERSIYVGITYKCKVRRVDKEGRKISVRPFAIIPADLPKVERMRLLSKKVPTLQ